jgi:hypothetical protein
MAHDVYLRREAHEFLRNCGREERQNLLTLLDSLAQSPFTIGDFTEKDRTGREVQGLICRRAAILFWADHAVKEVKVVDIRLADR